MQTSDTAIVCVSMLITCLHEKLRFHLGKNVYPALVAVGKNNLENVVVLYAKNKENISRSKILLLKIISK